MIWVYVNRVTTAGSIDVYDVTQLGPRAPPPGTLLPSLARFSEPSGEQRVSQWVGVDITTEVQTRTGNQGLNRRCRRPPSRRRTPAVAAPLEKSTTTVSGAVGDRADGPAGAPVGRSCWSDRRRRELRVRRGRTSPGGLNRSRGSCGRHRSHGSCGPGRRHWSGGLNRSGGSLRARSARNPRRRRSGGRYWSGGLDWSGGSCGSGGRDGSRGSGRRHWSGGRDRSGGSCGSGGRDRSRGSGELDWRHWCDWSDGFDWIDRRGRRNRPRDGAAGAAGPTSYARFGSHPAFTSPEFLQFNGSGQNTSASCTTGTNCVFYPIKHACTLQNLQIVPALDALGRSITFTVQYASSPSSFPASFTNGPTCTLSSGNCTSTTTAVLGDNSVITLESTWTGTSKSGALPGQCGLQVARPV